MVSSALLLLAAASYASAARVLVGFRTVCEAEANEINERGWVYWDPNHSTASFEGQLGIGKSHSNTAGLWSGFIAGNLGGDWFCYTTAEESKIRKTGKVWINPIEQPAAGQTQYPYNEAKIREILTEAGSLKPQTCLRLGRVMDGEELLIPAAALPGPSDTKKKDGGKGGKLELETYCFPSQEAMKAHMTKNGIASTADYDSDIFIGKNYKAMDQMKKRATADEGEGAGEGEAAAAGPARLLRFMPRDLKARGSGATAPKGNGKPAAPAPMGNGKPAAPAPMGNGKPAAPAPMGSGSAAASSGTLQLAKGYTITLRKDPNSKKFPAPKRGQCPTKKAAPAQKPAPAAGNAGKKLTGGK